MKAVLLTDLDDTFFQSLRSLGHQDELTTAALDRHGNPICFQTNKQRWLNHLLTQFDEVIPVTGRSSESLERVVTPKFTSFRIASHGAIILNPQGAMLEGWYQTIAEEVQEWSRPLEECSEILVRWQEQHMSEVRVKRVFDQNILTYLSVKGTEIHLKTLVDLLESQQREYTIHHNQRNLAVLPSYTSKARAVSYLINHLQNLYTEPLLFLGAGDSVTDVPFLKLCDFALTPKASLIHKVLWS